MIWEKFPQIIFTVETWHSLIWYLILMMQQHSSPLICTNDCFIQCNFFEVRLFKKINNTLIFHPSIMILVLQAAQPFMSWSLQSTLALSGPKAITTGKVWGSPSCLLPWYSGEGCKHFSYCKHDKNDTNQSLQHAQNKSQPPVTPLHGPLRALHCSILFWVCAGHSWHRVWPRGCPEPPGPSHVFVLEVEHGEKGSSTRNRSYEKCS